MILLSLRGVGAPALLHRAYQDDPATAGLHSVCISLPAIVGRAGATPVLEPELDQGERGALLRSASILQQAQASVSV